MKFCLSIEDCIKGFCVTRREQGSSIMDVLYENPSSTACFDYLRMIKSYIDPAQFREVEDKILCIKKLSSGVKYKVYYDTVMEVASL